MKREPILAIVPPRVYPQIGSRWTPGPIERRDTSTGFYECVNSRHDNESERSIQRLLLTKTPQELKGKK